jgi:endonuclease/exonuclease/phosphatase family metal-dependent hydrolase
MPPFPNPEPHHTFTAAPEISALDTHFTSRQVPTPGAGRLLLASWNIANLGEQKRSDAALEVIAHILKRFDLCAVQEIKDDFRHFVTVVEKMGAGFDYVMTDTAGNDERLAFVYRKSRVKCGNLFAELALHPREYPKRTVKVRWEKDGQPQVQVFEKMLFEPFDRTPYIGSFASGKIDFTLANVHLYFGKFEESKTEKERRQFARRVLEIYALSRWADRYIKQGMPYDRDVILLGDMNIPRMEGSNPAYTALAEFKWHPLDYLAPPAGAATSATPATPESAFISKVGGSNLGGDSSYDQMVFAPQGISADFHQRIQRFGVFDFDNAVFKPLWQNLSSQLSKPKAISKFNAHVKFHLSDHRPLWVALKTN